MHCITLGMVAGFEQAWLNIFFDLLSLADWEQSITLISTKLMSMKLICDPGAIYTPPSPSPDDSNLFCKFANRNLQFKKHDCAAVLAMVEVDPTWSKSYMVEVDQR